MLYPILVTSTQTLLRNYVLSWEESLSFIFLLFVFILVFPQKEPRLPGFKSLLGRNLAPQKQILETL